MRKRQIPERVPCPPGAGPQSGSTPSYTRPVDPMPVRVIPRRADTIVGFGETRIHAETATFEVRASEVASPRQGDQLTVDGETFVIQGEPERRDPDRLVWTLDVRRA
jgi:hypothetical protein